ncbi:MAG: N-acetyltransferase, partial [Betaproteobacteria bacterium]
MDTPLVADGLRIRPYVAEDLAEFISAVRESMATVGVWMAWCREPYST